MTTPRIVTRPRATDDIDDHAAYIAQRSPHQANRFLDAVSRTTQYLAAMPGLGAGFSLQNPQLQGLRHWPVDGFPNHIIYYLEIADGIDVVRVLHASRDALTVLEAEP